MVHYRGRERRGRQVDDDRQPRGRAVRRRLRRRAGRRRPGDGEPRRTAGVEVERGIHHVLAGRASVHDVLVERSEGFYLVPGDQPLGLVSEADPGNLGDVVRPLSGAVDVVLVDTGAGLGHETLVAAGLADGVLVVSTPVEAAVDDVSRTVAFVDHADATVLGAVVTRTDDRTDLGRIADDLGVRVVGTVPEDPAIETDPVTTGDAGPPIVGWRRRSSPSAGKTPKRSLRPRASTGRPPPRPTRSPTPTNRLPIRSSSADCPCSGTDP